MTLIDTNVLVDYLRGHPKAVEFLEGLERPFRVSVVTSAELLAGARTSGEEEALQAFVATLMELSVGPDIAHRAGQFCARFRGSHGVGLADALIAATAECHGLALATLNRRHFPMLQEVTVPYAP